MKPPLFQRLRRVRSLELFISTTRAIAASGRILHDRTVKDKVVVRRGRSRDQVAATLRRRDEKPLAVNRTAARGQRQESKSEELSLLLIRGLTKRLALLQCRRIA